MDEEAMGAVFSALASESRRRMLDILKESPGCTVQHVASRFDMSRIAVMKHLRVLEEAGLLTSEKAGRARCLHFNAVPIQMIHDRWTTELSSFWAQSMTKLKYRLESQGNEHA